MNRLMQYLRIVVIVFIVLEAILLAGCNTVNNTANINSSYDAIKTAYANDPSNSEIAFIYDAIHNQISEYPKNVPNFINLPIVSIIDAIGEDKRISIDYVSDNDFENGIIIAQEPKPGARWGNGVVVNLTVNRKYNPVNSKWGDISLSLDKLYLLPGYFDNDNNLRGTIWADGEKLIDGEITKIYADNGNVYYGEGNEIKRLNGESILQVPGQERIYYAVMNEKIYYIDQEEDNEYNKLYCYNIYSKTNTLVNEGRMLFIVNSNYIICWNTHDILIIDNKNNTIIKSIHCDKMVIDCSLDKDNVYFVLYTYNEEGKDTDEIIKYSIKQDTQTPVFEPSEFISSIYAIDDKLIFFTWENGQTAIRYLDMRNKEEKFFTIGDNLDYYVINDILFDGQRIIYEQD